MERILIVDDDADMIKITERWLVKAGYDVATSTSGREAVDIIKGKGYDLVLLDYAMPDMDGKATLMAIREFNSDIKVLFRTGKDDLDIEEVVSSYQANGFLSKAEGKPKLLAAIEGVLKEV